MRYFITLPLILILSLPTYSQSTTDWTEISDNVPGDLPDGNFTDVYFIGDEGWITFDELYNNHGAILYTDNAGMSFTILTVPEVPNVIEMIDAGKGFAGCLSGNVYYTNDGGVQWKLLSGSLGSEIYGIDALADPLMGYACGEYGYISIFDTNQVYPPDQPFSPWYNQIDMLDIEFPIDSNEGWVCGEYMIGHYHYGTWDSLNAPQCRRYYSLCFINSDTGWSTGGQGMVMTPVITNTTDGINWNWQSHPLIDQWLYDIYFIDKDWGWSVGMYILSTIDGGETWVKEAQNYGNTWYALHAVDSSAVYVVGRNKRILKRDIIISLEELQISRILNTYPNPFKVHTTLEYELSTSSNIQFTIYNNTGREVFRIEEKYELSGHHSILLSLYHLPSGLYYGVLKSDKEVCIVKMVKR
ncbi:MAG: T9SS type A sorting domain-containing protein [Bacteroidota bacterium]